MIIIREEQDSDIGKIKSMYKEIYLHCLSLKSKNPPKNHLVVEELRLSGDLILSLVAEFDDQVVGHIAFSPVKINDHTSQWVGLAPVSVELEHQNKGIGTELINRGLDRIRMLNYDGVVVLSDMDCFRRLGFNNKPHLEMHDEPDKDTYAVSLNAVPPKGKVSFHPAFTRRAWGYSVSST